MAIRREEWPSLAVSFVYFFLLLASYYTVRPMRDALGANVIGSANLKYAFTSVFFIMLALVPLFGLLAARVPRRRLVPIIYAVFLACIVGFYGLFSTFGETTALAYAFWIWVSIFNVFVVSAFWSFMADIYDGEQSRRLFAPIAAGGSLGAIVGPYMAGQLVPLLGVANMLLVAGALLFAAMTCVVYLVWKGPQREIQKATAMGGGVIEGARLAIAYPFLRGLGGFMLLGTFTGSLLHLLQTRVFEQMNMETGTLMSTFSTIDLAVNLLVLFLQLFVTHRLLKSLGLTVVLMLLPIIVLAGSMAVAFVPVVGLIVAMQVMRRATLFAITNPVSHTLFAPMGPKTKYKFKSFLETAVYRGGDTTGSWLFPVVLGVGGISAVGVLGALAALGWVGLARWLGQRYAQIDEGRDLP